MAKRVSLEEWITEARNDKAKDSPCTAMALMHRVGVSTSEVWGTKIGTGQNWSDKDLAEVFQGKADAYSQDLPGVQTFNLLAFYSKAESEACHPFLVNGNNGLNGMSTEGPTPDGQRQQQQRHLEMGFQLNYNQSARLFTAYENMCAAADRRSQIQAAQIESLMKENHDAFDIVKEIMMKQANDTHEHKMKEMQFERSSTERKKLLGYVPSLVNTVAGKEVFPQSAEDTALVEAIAEQLTEQSITQLAGVLPATLMGPLAARLQKYEEKKRKDREAQEVAMRELPPGDPDSELSD